MARPTETNINSQPAINKSLTYALITPARNEAAMIEGTFSSVLAQTVRPARWIIVSDGSTDGTDDIVRRFAGANPWIELLRMPERRDRQFAAKAHAFNAGYARLKAASVQSSVFGVQTVSGLEQAAPGLQPSTLKPQASTINQPDFDIVGNLDADITFGPDYFGFLLGKFQADSRLGVAGTPFVEDSTNPGEHTYAHRFAQLEHVSGACQMFRRECFEQVGGYVPIKGGAIDWIAVTTARMKGWKTRTFTEKVCFHHRKIGTGSGSENRLGMRLHYGRKAYYVGSHPLWTISRGVFQMRQKPYVLGGFCFLLGYLWAVLRRMERPVSAELIAFYRAEQMARLRQALHLPSPRRLSSAS